MKIARTSAETAFVQLLLDVLHRVNDVIRSAGDYGPSKYLMDYQRNYLHPSMRPLWIWDDSPFKMSTPRDWQRGQTRGTHQWGDRELLVMRGGRGGPYGWGTIQ